jgi:hypothetical protein
MLDTPATRSLPRQYHRRAGERTSRLVVQLEASAVSATVNTKRACSRSFLAQCGGYRRWTPLPVLPAWWSGRGFGRSSASSRIRTFRRVLEMNARSWD